MYIRFSFEPFLADYKNGKFFSQAPEFVLAYFEGENITYNYHHYCFDPELARLYLKNYFLTSTGRDKNGAEFLSSMEHKVYPFYAVQYHPEKNIFEFLEYAVPHNIHSVEVSHYTAAFFVNEARKNNNSFPSKRAANEAVIYNYPAIYVGTDDLFYEQIYGFSEADFEGNQLL